jgi:eukaryotic-like serine/threonine-protein kinase
VSSVRLGKYQLLRKLATGGMAEVFLAKTAGPMGFEKQLVIKRILPHLAEDPQFVEMFLGEAKLAAQLNHPNLVQIFDFGEAEGSYFIAMEYIDGPTIRLLLQRAREAALAVPLVLGARVVSAAAEGLAYAHEFTDAVTDEPLQLIHRDVSPDNILVSRSGSVKVVDFGIAKARGLSHHTQTGTIKGKVAYMAPEQLKGEVLDRRVDLYGLGVVLYELLTLKMPYEAASDASLVRKVLYEAYVPPAERRPELPLGLQQILAQLLAKNRDERYSDCRTLHADLERYIHATGETASGFALSQLVARLVPPAPAGTPIPEAEMPIFTPTALGAVEPRGAVFPLDAAGVDVEAKTAVGAARQRRTAPEGFVFPSALEAERSGVHTPRVDFAHTDLHGSTGNTDPSLDVIHRGHPFLRAMVWLLGLALVAGGGWFAWSTWLTPPTPSPAVASEPRPEVPPPVSPPVVASSPVQPAAPPPAPTPAPAASPLPPPAPSAPPVENAKEAAKEAPPKPSAPIRSTPAPMAKLDEAVPSKLLGAFEAAEAQAPKEEAPAETGAASIRLESTPPLRIRVGNRILGTTPLVVKLPEPGPVDVELFDPGLGLTRVEHVELKAGDNGIRKVTFEKGAIDFQVQPGITVYVDGKRLGVAPFDKPVPFYEGKHPVRLVLGDEEERRLVTVTPGETETLEFTFER